MNENFREKLKDVWEGVCDYMRFFWKYYIVLIFFAALIILFSLAVKKEAQKKEADPAYALDIKEVTINGKNCVISCRYGGISCDWKGEINEL